MSEVEAAQAAVPIKDDPEPGTIFDKIVAGDIPAKIVYQVCLHALTLNSRLPWQRPCFVLTCEIPVLLTMSLLLY